MSIDDELRAAMRENDSQAPTRLVFTPPARPNSRRWLLPSLASAAVVIIATTVLVTTGTGSRTAAPPADRRSPSATSGSLACPATVGRSTQTTIWVPPSTYTRSSQLVPDRAPLAATACSYVNGQHRSRVLHDLATIPASLSLAPARVGDAVCPLYLARTDGENYLLGLRYPAGTLWVSAPRNHCTGSSNGSFVSRRNLGAEAATAVNSGRWPAAPITETPYTRGRCGIYSTGRLGDEKQLVPPGATTIDVCRTAGPIPRVWNPARTLTGRDVTSVAARFNALTTEPDMSACITDKPGTVPAIFTTLVVGYPDGANVELTILSGCRANVQNGALQARAPASLLADFGG